MKTVLITGASRGIGRACALKFAENGYAVAANYNKSEEEAFKLVSEIRSAGGTAMAVKADISSPEEIGIMMARVRENFPVIDVLVNNAGVSSYGLLAETTPAEWDRLFNTMVRGSFLCTKSVLPTMNEYHHGSIVNISSIWGQVGASCEVAYSAAKAAIIGFTKALAKELGPSGIRVNCIAPGVIDTDMNKCHSAEILAGLCGETPLMRMGKPEEVADMAVFLASEKSSFVTGQIISVDGGIAV